MNPPFMPVSADENGELVQLTLSRQPRCPYCRDDIHLGEALLVCPACHAVMHQECLGKGGRCTTYGCRYGTPLESPPPRPRVKRIAAALALIAVALGAGSWGLHDSPPPPPSPPPPMPPAAPIPTPLPERLPTAPPYLSIFISSIPSTVEAGRLTHVEGTVYANAAVDVSQVVLAVADAQVPLVWSEPRKVTPRSNLNRCCTPPTPMQLRTAQFSVPLRLEPGRKAIRVIASAPTGTASQSRSVLVTAPPTPPPPPPTPIPGLIVPSVVDGNEVIIRGQLEGEGPLSISVRGPTGSVAWKAFEPGPFATAVTLPGQGRHQIVVEVTDAWGSKNTARYVVTRR